MDSSGALLRRKIYTWHNVARVHRILIFDEAKAVHELDLHDLSSAVSVEMRFNVRFGR